MRYRHGPLIAILVVLAAACAADAPAGAGGQSERSATPAPTDAAMAPSEDGAVGGATVMVSATDLGDVIADGDGATLYLFTPDEQGEPTCYDDCEQNWPPLAGPAQPGDGADDALLGTVEREDGTVQVTYNDWPLYYFAGDTAPGDTAGQGVGDVWFVLDPAGEPVKDKAARPGQY